MQLIKSTLFFVLAFFAQFSIAQTQIPFNGSVPIEMKNYGNSYSWVPAQSGPGKGLTFSSNAGVSTVEPKLSGDLRLPYSNKAANSKLSLNIPIDPSKVSSKAAQALKAGAKGLGYVGLASIACELADCAEAASALIGWGVEKIKKNDDGTISVMVPDPDTTTFYSDGYRYGWSESSSQKRFGHSSSYQVNCKKYFDYHVSSYPDRTYQYAYCTTSGVRIFHGGVNAGNNVYQQAFTRSIDTTCPSGSPVVGGICNGESVFKPEPLETYLQSNYTGKGWDHHWAKMTAAIVASGGNVFTDGTSTDITGPAIVPVSTSESKTSVSLVPGTTTPAPAGHTGPTESGTQTTTTTTTAHNKFNPAPMASGSSGSPASGPSMETTQKTTTTTTITNNVTNITNIVNETTTEKDEAPEEAPTDTPFADLPELYKQKYPDGLIGVLRTQTAAMKATPLFQLPMQLMGDLPQTGQCPSWQLDLSLASWASFGTYNVGADCAIWDFAGWVIVISAFILARQLIFGG